MKLSKRSFNRTLKRGWNDMIPESEKFPELYKGLSLRRVNDRKLTVWAAALFCILFTSLFVSPGHEKFLIDIDKVQNNKVLLIVTLLNQSEGIR